ncbi:MAG: SprB repeat-containing protein, partial [Bacteroidia bacterium]
MSLNFTIITCRYSLLILTILISSFSFCDAEVKAEKTSFPPAGFILTFSITNYNGYAISCNGVNDGEINLIISGGVAPFIIKWNNGDSTSIITGLSAGYYQVIVIDSIGDIDSIDVTLTEPPVLNVSLGFAQKEPCYNDTIGYIDIDVNGGVNSFYTFLWSNGSTTEDIQNLAAALYSVTVTDQSNCSASLSQAIVQPPQILISLTSDTSYCNLNSGAVNVTGSGGTGAFNYLWNTGAVTSIVTNLIPGTYTVTVSDANGCNVLDSVSVFDAASPVIILDSIYNTTCFNFVDGSIEITVQSGTSFSFAWSDGSTTEDIANLIAGNYSVTVTNEFACKAQSSFTVQQPNELLISLTATDENCGQSNGSVVSNVTGGTGNYNYFWSNGNTATSIISLLAGTYTITVTDDASCTSGNSVTLSNIPGPVISNITAINVNCNGGTGSITVNVNGGVLPYSFAWSSGSTDQNIFNLPPGTYTLTVTDSNNCQVTVTQIITQSAALSISLGSTSDGCNHQSGVASAIVSGGTPGYIYLWSNGETNSTITNLSATVYTVTVNDALNCSVTDSIIVSSTPSPSIIVNQVVDISCNGDSTGSIDISVTGGNSFNYLWSNGVTTEDNLNVPSGNYSVIVTNEFGCTTSLSFTINEPSQIIVNAVITDAVCNLSNGSAVILASGGTGSLSYLWSDGSTLSTLLLLPAGTYIVTVTDGVSCSVSTNVNISDLLGPVITNIAASNVSCYGGSDGSIDVSIFGGTNPIQYFWSDGSTLQDITSIPSGTYTLTVVDANGCQTSVSQVVSQPSVINITSSTFVDSCSLTRGSISLNISGGTPGYSFLWSNNATTSAIGNLSSGTYTVTVTDFNNCTQTVSVSIIPSPVPSIVTNLLQNVSCNGGTDGAINISTTGGFTFDFVWSNGSVIQNQNLITAGTYTVTVSNNYGCTATQSYSITEPPLIQLSLNSIDATCGSNNGSVNVTPNGGTGILIYLWNNGNTNSSLVNIPGGLYTVTVTDDNLCSTSASVNVLSQNGPSITNIAHSDVSCNGGSNGSITFSITGGSLPFQYAWSNGSSVQNQTNLTSGTYTVTVSDANSCTAIVSQVISEPSQLNLNVASSSSTCGLSNGSVGVTVTGGTGSYSYLWNNGNTTGTISNLSAGAYTVTVTDGNGCTATGSSNITDLGGPNITNLITTDVSCNGGNNGGISITTVGGTLPLQYIWSDGSSTQNISGLASGTYTVTVTDANNCSNSITQIVTQPALLTASITTTSSTCGQSNGSATVTAGGGTGSYTYQWNTGNTLSQINNEASGTYTVTVTDGNGCAQNATSIINNQSGPSINSITPTNVSCNGGNDGSIITNTSGGTAPLSYSWSNGATTQSINNLLSGTYSITVTDANGCTTAQSSIITSPTAITITATSTPASCNQSTGSVSATASGGTGTLNYLWNTSATSTIVINLPAGIYTVTVTDANGCTQTDNANISNLTGPGISSSTTTNVSCNGGNNGSITTTITGGSPPLTYSWNNGTTTQNNNNLTTGNYTLIVTDANGCQASTTEIIAEPTAIATVMSSTVANCNTNAGTAAVAASGGTGALSYQWSTGGTTSTINNLFPAVYTITVTDANSCSTTSTVTVSGSSFPVIGSAITNNVSCSGGNNGSISITVTGNNPINYQWSDGVTTEDRLNLNSGTYTVTVTDTYSCTVTGSYTITSPLAITITPNITNSTCGINNGSISLTVNGGAGGYNYLWNTGATTSSINNILQGSFQVTVTDGNGCTKIAAANVSSEASPAISNVTSSNVSCNGGSNGSITIITTGGTLPLSFNWSNGITTQNQNNLSSGTYTVTVTDANGCTDAATQVIIEPSQLSLNVTNNPATCGLSNGSAQVVVSGGTVSYSYLWNNGNTTNSLINLAPATYNVTVTDGNGCTATGSLTVTNLDGPVITNVTVTNITCNGSNNGGISITTSGGAAPIQYNWSNGISTQNISGLISGTYTVIVMDANNCTNTITQILTQPAALTASTSATSSTCGQSNGSATVTAGGGTGSYTYQWNTGNTLNLISNEASGTYIVTVTDGNGCTRSATAVINNQSGPVIGSITPAHVSCNGGNDGTITISVTGGTAPITYNWSNGATTAGNNNLSSGIYTITVTDANGCTATQSTTITSPTIISVTASSTAASCNQNTGSVSAIASGGTGTLSYQWNTGAISTIVINLPAGTYSVTVTDANGCTQTDNANISNLTGPAISNTIANDVTCNGGNNGSITTSIAGGTPPLTYTWNNGATTQNNNNLTAGNYTLTVTDANGCQASTTQLITEPSAITALMSSAIANCNNNVGSATVTANGGTGTLNYQWSTGGITGTINNLFPGVYTVTVTDANICTTTSSVTVQGSNPPIISGSIVNNVSCQGGNNGAINITVTGNNPLTYQWSDGSSADDRFNLAVGTYIVTVTDIYGCTITGSYDITSPSAITISPAIINSTCGINNGSINLTVNGGTGSYVYLWNTGATTNSLNNLLQGSYQVTVTDGNSCTKSATVNVNSVTGPVISNITNTNVSCNGGSNGSITLSITGGTLPFQYNWSNGSTVQNQNNLVPGLYALTVTDGNGCTVTTSQVITQPSPLNLNPSVTPETCGLSNGSAMVIVTGGTIPYSYNWSNGATTLSINALSNGTYTITVTDGNSCINIANVNVVNLTGPSVSASAVGNISCFGGSNGFINTIVSGGTSPFQYLWSNGFTTQNVSNLSVGIYTMTITDINNCSATLTQSVSEPAVLTMNITPQPASCNQGNGQVNANALGGTGNLSFLWNNGSTGSSILNVFSGTYTVTVTDANNCTLSSSVVVANLPGPAITNQVVTPVSCYGGTDGSVNISVSNGTLPFQYNWNNGATTQNINNLSVGTYSLTVTDVNGCSMSTSLFVSQPPQILLVISSIPPIGSFNNGSATINASGGTGTFTYFWNTGYTTTTIINLKPGVYTVTVTDANNCTASMSHELFSQSCPDVINVVFSDVSCNGGSDAFINITDTGGLAPIQYSWSNGSTTQDINNISVGTYTLIITDANNCGDTAVQVINEPTAITANTTTAASTCGQSNGSVSITASGGTGTLTYNWNTGATTTTVTNLTSGTYTVTVTDGNNCAKSATAIITDQNGPTINSITPANVSCNGGNDGSISVTTIGGTLPVTYNWSNGASTQNINTLTAGTYTITISDANNCTATASAAVTEPTVITANATSTTSACGQSNGSVSITASGGTGTLTYNWNTGATTTTVTNLPSGTYTVTVTDANNCTKTATAIITDQNGPAINSITPTNVSCNGGNDGSISITTIGGTLPVTYNWSSGASTQNINTLTSGTYTITISDANNCTATSSATVTEPTVITANTTTAASTCGQSNGSVSVTANGGTGTLTYNWNTGATASTVTNLASGTYTVTVTDANNCTKTATAIITDQSGPTINSITTTNVSCNGGNDGSINVTASGGTLPITYAWNNGGTTQSINTLT